MKSMISWALQGLLALALVAFFAAPAMADSTTVSYQGMLRDATLSPVADGAYAMIFSIWDAESAGTKRWGDESHPAVQTTNGMFSVYLGGAAPLGTLFSQYSALWLEISADTGAGMETYAPRAPLASIPYAQYAARAGDASTLGGATFATHNADAAAHPALHLPPGVMMPYAGNSAPSGYLLCAGQTVSRTTYAALFAAIGITYGAGDGSTTFNLPDLRGRVPLGLDNMGGTSANRVTAAQADVLGGAAGAETHTLTVAQMPAHNHGINDPGHAHNYSRLIDEDRAFLAGGGSDIGHWLNTFATAAATTGISIQSAGSGQAHNNMQPYIALNYVIKY